MTDTNATLPVGCVALLTGLKDGNNSSLNGRVGTIVNIAPRAADRYHMKLRDDYTIAVRAANIEPIGSEARTELKRKTSEAECMRKELQEAEQPLKKFRADLASNLTSNLTCSITHALPIDPVTARDGHVYERGAIEKWLAEHGTSPITRESIGATLLPARQVLSTIQELVSGGMLDQDAARQWEHDTLTQAARSGCPIAMYKCGCFIYHNVDIYPAGIPEQQTKIKDTAMLWFKKSARKGYVPARALLGEFFMRGIGGVHLNTSVAGPCGSSELRKAIATWL